MYIRQVFIKNSASKVFINYKERREFQRKEVEKMESIRNIVISLYYIILILEYINKNNHPNRPK